MDSSAQAVAADSRSVPPSEKAMSQPPSPATAKPNGHAGDHPYSVFLMS